MMHNEMMVGAFSHSTAVGKLRKDLPDVPAEGRVKFPRYTFDEAATVCHFYLRYDITINVVVSAALVSTFEAKILTEYLISKKKKINMVGT